MKEFNVEYKNGLDLKLLLPEEESFSLFVYFHGGGLEHGTNGGCEVFAETLCKSGVGVATVNYRMYPNAKFPDYIEDCAAAVAWCFKNISSYGKCDKIYAGGSSAGGYISMMLQFDNKYLQKYDIKSEDLAGYIHDAGQPTTHFNVISKEYGLDGRRVMIDERAPIYHICEDKNYSPMLIIVSDNDMENRYEQTQLLISTLKHFGYEDKVSYKLMNGTHCAYVYKKDEDGEGVLGKLVAEFVKKIESK